MSTIIWKYQLTPQRVNELFMTNMIQLLGIECVEVGNDYLVAKMPVDQRTRQSAGLLHGGANVALAETIGSLAANLCLDQDVNYEVGLEINAKHIKQVMSGWVTGIAEPIHLGRSTQIWGIKIYDEAQRLICISRITLAILSLSKAVNRI